MRPEPAANEDMREMARLLGTSPALAREALGSALPRIIGSRSSMEEAEALARVLTARGRESIAWDRERPLVQLFEAERLVLEGGQFMLEQRSRGRRFIPARDIQRIVDLRLRSQTQLFDGGKSFVKEPQQAPGRAVLFVPEPGRGEPGFLSAQSVDTGNAGMPALAAGQLLQEAVNKARALVKERVMEVRTTSAVLGLEAADGDLLSRALQLLARLPPTPGSGAGSG